MFPRAATLVRLGDAVGNDAFAAIVAGRASLTDGTTPPAYVAAVLAAWKMQLDDVPAFMRVLVRTLLPRIERDGFLPALAYLIDLVRDGVVIHPEALVEVARVLLLARRCAADDGAIAACFERDDPTGGPVLRDDLDDDLYAVIDRTAAEIDRVRAVESFDDWIAGQAFIYALTRFALHLFARLGCADQLPFIAEMDRFEEVRADAGSVLLILRVKRTNEWWPYAATYTSRSTYVGRADEDLAVVQRLLAQRPVVPSALLDRFFRDDRSLDGLGPAWSGVSATLAPVIGRALFGDAQFPTRRRTSFTSEQIRVLTKNVDLFFAIDVQDVAARTALISRCCGTRNAAESDAIRAAGIDDARAAQLVDTLVGRCAALEISTFLEIAEHRTADGDDAGALTVLRQLAENYPWFAAARARIARLATGAEALAAAIEAMVLDPTAADSWTASANDFAEGARAGPVCSTFA